MPAANANADCNAAHTHTNSNTNCHTYSYRDSQGYAAAATHAAPTPESTRLKHTAHSMITDPKRSLARLRRGTCVLLSIAAAAVMLARITVAVAADGRVQPDVQCDPVPLLLEFFDGVTPPALPTGWSDMGDIQFRSADATC